MIKLSITPKYSQKTAIFILFFLVIIIWGVTWPVMKIGLNYIPPLFFGATRMFVGSICIFTLLLLLRLPSIPCKDDIGIILSISLLQMTIPIALMHFSLSFVDAGRASLLAFTHPLWVAPAAVFLLNEPLNKGTIAGLIVSITGLTVLFNPSGFDWANRDTLIGNGLLILSAMSWAAGIVHVRAHNWKSNLLALSPWQMLVAGIILLVFSIAREDIASTNWQPELVYILAFVGIAATGFCYWGSVTISRYLPAMITSLGFLCVPVIGILSSILILSETITKTLVIGSVLIVSGLVVIVFFGDKIDES